MKLAIFISLTKGFKSVSTPAHRVFIDGSQDSIAGTKNFVLWYLSNICDSCLLQKNPKSLIRNSIYDKAGLFSAKYS